MGASICFTSDTQTCRNMCIIDCEYIGNIMIVYYICVCIASMRKNSDIYMCVCMCIDRCGVFVCVYVYIIVLPHSVSRTSDIHVMGKKRNIYNTRTQTHTHTYRHMSICVCNEPLSFKCTSLMTASSRCCAHTHICTHIHTYIYMLLCLYVRTCMRLYEWNEAYTCCRSE